MRIAIVSRHPYIQKIGENMRNRFGYNVSIFNKYEDIGKPEIFDTVFVYNIGRSTLLAVKGNHNNLIVGTAGVEIYMNGIKRVSWDKVNTLLALQQHQLDYFTRTYSDRIKVKRCGVVPLPALPETFTFKKNRKINNNVAMVANITGRKGEENIPEFLRRFKKLHLHHLGQVCEYGNAVNEFVNWQLKRDGNDDRYHRTKHEYFRDMNEWYEDKTYLWHPSISEGMGRAVLEGMTKGLMPIVKRYAGAEDLWSKENTYDTFDEVEDMLNREYEPEKYRDYVCEKYDINKIINEFKQYL